MATERRPKRDRGGMSRDQIRKYQNEREKDQHDRIERLLSEIVKRPRNVEFGIIDAMMELEESRMIALSAEVPQTNAAVNATIAKAKLMGLIIERSAALVAHGALQTNPDTTDDAIFERLRERIGSGPTQVFMKFVEDMRRAYRGEPPDDDGENE